MTPAQRGDTRLYGIGLARHSERRRRAASPIVSRPRGTCLDCRIGVSISASFRFLRATMGDYDAAFSPGWVAFFLGSCGSASFSSNANLYRWGR